MPRLTVLQGPDTPIILRFANITGLKTAEAVDILAAELLRQLLLRAQFV